MKSIRGRCIRDSLCKLKNLHPFETTCQTTLRYLHHLGTDLKETFNEILHSQSWRNKGMNISLASRISRIRNRVNYPSLNTNNIFYYKNISYHVVSSSNQDIKCSFRNQPENQERTKARKMKKEVEQGYSKFQACCGNEPSLPHACFV